MPQPSAFDVLSVPDLLRNFLLAEATANNLASIAASETNRYGGNKLAFAGVVSAAGDNTVVTPSAGKRIKLYWVYTLASPDAATCLITIKLGGVAVYASYGVAHWEPFLGAVDAPVVINLSTNALTAVTVHYQEI